MLPAKSKDKADTRKRQAQGILQTDAVLELRSSQLAENPGYPHGASYATSPQNRYQKWLRQGMDEGELVTGHYTKRFTAHIVETYVRELGFNEKMGLPSFFFLVVRLMSH